MSNSSSSSSSSSSRVDAMVASHTLTFQAWLASCTALSSAASEAEKRLMAATEVERGAGEGALGVLGQVTSALSPQRQGGRNPLWLTHGEERRGRS